MQHPAHLMQRGIAADELFVRPAGSGSSRGWASDCGPLASWGAGAHMLRSNATQPISAARAAQSLVMPQGADNDP
jgi:hypothetical protein